MLNGAHSKGLQGWPAGVEVISAITCPGLQLVLRRKWATGGERGWSAHFGSSNISAPFSVLPFIAG